MFACFALLTGKKFICCDRTSEIEIVFKKWRNLIVYTHAENLENCYYTSLYQCC